MICYTYIYLSVSDMAQKYFCIFLCFQIECFVLVFFLQFSSVADENQDYFVKLKQLVEETYESNGKTSVILLAHSMGGPMSQYFLNLQKQNWKDKYIKCLVTLSGAWGGSVKAVKVFAIGTYHILLLR